MEWSWQALGSLMIVVFIVIVSVLAISLGVMQPKPYGKCTLELKLNEDIRLYLCPKWMVVIRVWTKTDHPKKPGVNSNKNQTLNLKHCLNGLNIRASWEYNLKCEHREIDINFFFFICNRCHSSLIFSCTSYREMALRNHLQQMLLLPHFG